MLRTRLIRALVVTPPLLGLGCATTGGETARPASTDNCAQAPASDSRTPVVALLTQTGVTDPNVTTRNRRALEKVVSGSEQLEANVLVNGVTGTSRPPNLLVNTEMVGTGNNTLQRENDVECKREAIGRAQRRLETMPGSDRLDLLSALRTLQRSLEGAQPKEVHVVVMASAVQTETVNLGDKATVEDPARSINKLAAEQLNFQCPGWRVYFVTTSLRTGSAVSAEADARLKNWWLQYVRRCGGALVSYNSELARFPLPAESVEAADVRRLPVTVKRTPETIVTTVGSDLLFSTGSARLRSGAERGLERVLPLLGEARGAVSIEGHTDSTGTASVNERLSRARAETVATSLTRRGTLRPDRLRVRGLGASRPIAGNATAAGRAQNRRVVVTVEVRQ